jgi:hypothetical protein
MGRDAQYLSQRKIMSHITSSRTVPGKPLITDLEAVKRAAINLGLVCEERSNYSWWGRSLGDYPIPDGIREADLGKNAVLVIAVPETDWAKCRSKYGKSYGSEGPYELGVVPDPQNPGCYTLMYDFISGGYGLDDYIGAPLEKNTVLAPTFMMHYRMCADALSAADVGDDIQFFHQPDGSWISYTVADEARLTV